MFCATPLPWRGWRIVANSAGGVCSGVRRLSGFKDSRVAGSYMATRKRTALRQCRPMHSLAPALSPFPGRGSRAGAAVVSGMKCLARHPVPALTSLRRSNISTHLHSSKKGIILCSAQSIVPVCAAPAAPEYEHPFSPSPHPHRPPSPEGRPRSVPCVPLPPPMEGACVSQRVSQRVSDFPDRVLRRPHPAGIPPLTAPAAVRFVAC